MRSVPLGLYRPGSSVWHRIPAGPKLVGLIGVGVAVVAMRGPWPALVALGVALAISLWARVPVRSTWRGLRPLLVVLTVIAAFQIWQRGWPVAVETIATTTALVVAATTYTTTTPMDDLLDAIVRGLRPLRRVGVRPERVALAFSLMIAAIPRLLDVFHETRDAARARGLERSPRATLAPFAVRAVGQALATGDALHARGLGDDD